MTDRKRVRPSKSADVSFPVAGLSARANIASAAPAFGPLRNSPKCGHAMCFSYEMSGATVAEFERFLAGIGLHFQ